MRWLCLIVFVLFAFGCGDDGGGMTTMDSGTGSDTGTDDPCSVLREAAPNPDQLSGPCCARTTNDPAAPNFRLAGLEITSPTTFSNMTIRILLGQALDEERFNWLFSIDDASTDGDVMVTTGFANRNADGSFSYAADDAPAPGDPSRWNPVSEPGSLNADVMSTVASSVPVTVPILTEEGEVDTELPLNALQLSMANLSEERNCVGVRERRTWDTTQGEVKGYVVVDTSADVNVAPLSTTLCKLIAGVVGDERACLDVPRAEWVNQPDSVCDDSGCVKGGCDGTTDCNAWELIGGFAAHAVVVQ